MKSSLGVYDGTAWLEDTSNLIVVSKPSFSGDKSENEATTWMNLAGSYERKLFHVSLSNIDFTYLVNIYGCFCPYHARPIMQPYSHHVRSDCETKNESSV